MQRNQLEHLIRAAAAITGEPRLIVIGSQAILGSHPDAPCDLLESVEADSVPLDAPQLADLIDGSIGEESPFHKTFGYYAQGVHIEVATLPDGWQARLVPIHNENTGGATALCLEVHDLAVSKLAAGRGKDLVFVGGLLQHGIAKADVLAKRIEVTNMGAHLKAIVAGRLQRLA